MRKTAKIKEAAARVRKFLDEGLDGPQPDGRVLYQDVKVERRRAGSEKIGKVGPKLTVADVRVLCDFVEQSRQ